MPFGGYVDRKCSRCKAVKPEREFARKNNKTGARDCYCYECRRAYSRDWYSKNRERHKRNCRRNSKRYVAHAQRFVWEYLQQRSCAECGEDDPLVLEFHHTGEKEFDIGNAARLGYPIGRIEKEIARCIVLCANCHRRKTAKERGWYRALAAAMSP
jgi:hypothetical protein